LASEESRNTPSFDSGFVPLIPSQIDPHPTVTSNGNSQLSPVFAEQNLFPSFFRSGHKLVPSSARPFANKPNPSLAGRYTSSLSSSSTRAPYDESILGSGDFTVLRGGTFWADNDGPITSDYYGSDSSFYDTTSGRPFALPLSSSGPHYSDDPFADFKDFADINAGVDSDFSHHIPVYAHKNAKHEPNNILETLELLDAEAAAAEDEDKAKNRETEVSTLKPIIKVTKISKFKSKLLGTKVTKERQQKKKPISGNSKKPNSQKEQSTAAAEGDYVDPLVAES